jgi:hypothetical protein
VAQDGWTFASRTNTCMVCQKSLVVGDTHCSALYQQQADLIRRDYCEKCWAESRVPGHYGFWRGVIPEPEKVEKKKRRLDASINIDTLFDILKEMPDDPDPAKRRFRFVLSLMVMRRKKLKLLQIVRRKSVSGDADEDFLVMQTTGRGAKQRFEIADVKMSEAEMISAQDEVGRLLALGGVDDAIAGGLGAGVAAAVGPAAGPQPVGPALQADDAGDATGGDCAGTPGAGGVAEDASPDADDGAGDAAGESAGADAGEDTETEGAAGRIDGRAPDTVE